MFGHDYTALYYHFADCRAERSVFGVQLDLVDMFDRRWHEKHSGIIDAKPTRELRGSNREDPEPRISPKRIGERLSALRKADSDAYLTIHAFFSSLPIGDGGEVDRVLPLSPIWLEHLRHMSMKERGVSEKSTLIELHKRALFLASKNELHRREASRARVEATALLVRAEAAWMGTAVVGGRMADAT